MSQGERFVARVHAHPRSMGPKIDSLYAILSSLLRNRFVLPLVDRTLRISYYRLNEFLHRIKGGRVGYYTS